MRAVGPYDQIVVRRGAVGEGHLDQVVIFRPGRHGDTQSNFGSLLQGRLAQDLMQYRSGDAVGGRVVRTRRRFEWHIGKAPTVGHLWSSEVAGYSIRCAIKVPAADGGERILLITDRRLGAYNDLWKPVGPDAATSYEFSVVELHVNSKGEGEGKASLTGKVALDSAAKTIGLENYGALPVILKNVRRK